MKFVSLSKVNEWKFSELDKLSGRGAQLKAACLNYVELVVAREAYEQLKGVPLTIKNLDGPVFNIGSGLVDEESGLYKMIRLRIDNAIVALKRHIILCLDGDVSAELSADIDKNELDTVLKSDDREDVRLASAIASFELIGRPLCVSASREMRNMIHVAFTKIKDNAEVGATGGMYAETWMSKLIAEKIKTERDSLQGGLKKLASKTKELCDKLDSLDIKSVAEFNMLLNGAVKRVCCIDYIGRKRVATKAEVNRLPANLYVEYANLIELDKYYSLICCIALARGISGLDGKLKAVCKAEDGSSTIPKEMEVKWKKDEAWDNVVYANVDALCANIDNFMKDITETLLKLKNGMRELEYPEQSQDTMVLAADVTIPEVIARIIEEKNRKGVNTGRSRKKSYGYDRGNVALNIAVNCDKKQEYFLTLKQMHVLRKEYEMLKQMDEAGVTVTSEECLQVANELMTNYKGQCNEVVVSIAERTIADKICSYKQLEVLKTRLNQIKGYEKIREQAQLGKLSAENVAESIGIVGATADGSREQGFGSTSTESKAPVPVFGVTPNNSEFDIDEFAKELFGV